MTRFPSAPRMARVAFTLSLTVGCVGQVTGGGGTPAAGTVVSAGNKPGAGNTSGTGSGPGQVGATGTGAVPGGLGTGSTPGSGSAGNGGVTGTVGGTGAVPVAMGDPNAAGARPLRLLTAREYMNTVRDLFSDTSTVATGLPDESEDPASVSPFHMTGDVATVDATLYRDAAEALAKNAVTKINTLLPCAATATTTNEAGCFTNTFMNGLAIKMYRRPLSAADKTWLMSLYTTATAAIPTGLGLTFSGAVGFVIETVLQAPEFLYHWEMDPTVKLTAESTGQVKLGGYEMANRLSYFLWGTMPDQTLFDAAAAGQLGDAASVEAQARRMLKDPNAGAMFGNFFVDWLDLDTLDSKPKSATLYPMYNATLTSAMAGEVQSFVNAIVTTGTGRFDELMTSTNSFANQSLAAIYKVNGVTGTAMKPVMLDATQRSGLLTSAGFMSLTGASDGSNPPRRGKAILYKLLCQTLPAPPNVVPDPKPVSPGVTTRQRFEEHSTNPCATACHTLLDPLGFAFENYDGIGQYRTTDNNLPVNASVTMMLDGQSQTFMDARGLAAALATSPQVQSCFATQWFRYALGRADTKEDLASIGAATTTFTAASRDVRELVVGVSTSRTFRYRTLATGEVLQ